MNVLVIDVGGTYVKILATGENEAFLRLWPRHLRCLFRWRSP